MAELNDLIRALDEAHRARDRTCILALDRQLAEALRERGMRIYRVPGGPSVRVAPTRGEALRVFFG